MSTTWITPELFVSIATLITAITALMRVLKTHQTVQANSHTMGRIEAQTNGALTKATARVAELEAEAAAHPQSGPPAA